MWQRLFDGFSVCCDESRLRSERGGRVVAKDAFYFPHDTNASNDPNLVQLFIEMQYEGYGIYWRLVELLHEAGGYYSLDSGRLAFVLRTQSDRILKVINDFDLFRIDGDRFTSERVLRNIKHREEKSKKAADNARKRSDGSASAQRPLSERSARKERKGKERKEKPDERFVAFWACYPKRIGKGAAEKAFQNAGVDNDLLAKIVQALKVQRESDQWKKDGGQFIPHPATWLNQKRWEDEVSILAPVNGSTVPDAREILKARGDL
jgi:uncharacterized protein YdaU (DUF1376 family)